MTDFERLFIDTSFIQGLYNKDDQYHKICYKASPFFENAKEFVTIQHIYFAV